MCLLQKKPESKAWGSVAIEWRRISYYNHERDDSSGIYASAWSTTQKNLQLRCIRSKYSLINQYKRKEDLFKNLKSKSLLSECGIADAHRSRGHLRSYTEITENECNLLGLYRWDRWLGLSPIGKHWTFIVFAAGNRLYQKTRWLFTSSEASGTRILFIRSGHEYGYLQSESISLYRFPASIISFQYFW